MSREHVVETLEWDLAFASRDEAFDWQSRLVSLARGPAVDAIHEVFEELGGGEEVLALDTLELDLGRLPRDGFEQALALRLRECLRDAVHQAMGGLRLPASPRSGPAARASRIDLLQHYLAHGFLPWQAGAGTRRRLDQLAEGLAQARTGELQRWLDEAPPAARTRLAALLRGHTAILRGRVDAALQGDAPLQAAARQAWAQLMLWDATWLGEQVHRHGQAVRVRRHLARHFDDPMLLALAALWVPTEGAFLAAVTAAAPHFGRAMDPPLAAGAARERIWEFTLGYLLVECGSEFNRRSYLASLLRQSARRDGVAYGHLLRVLMEQLSEAPVAGGLQREMLQLLGTLAAQEDEAAPHGREASLRLIAVSDREPQDALQHLGRMKLRVEGALLDDRGMDAAARQAWQRLLPEQGPWLAAQLRRHGQAEAVRQRMVRCFGHAMLLQAVALVAPEAAAFVDAVVSRPTWLARAMDPPLPPERLQPQLWDFTLAYLLVERGSEFNRRSYLAYVLRHSAQRHGMGQAELLQALMLGLAQAGTLGPEQRQMLELLRQLQARLPAQPVPPEAPPGSSAWMQRSLAQLRFAWTSACAAGTPGNAAAQQAWARLREHDAAWLREDLFMQLRSERNRRLLAQSLGEEGLRRAVNLLADSAGDWAAALAQQAAAAAANGTAGMHAAAPGAARRRVWEFTLGYLGSDRGTEFNRRSYLRGTLRRMALAEGVSELALLQAMAAGLQALPAADAVQRQMLALALDMLHEVQSQGVPAPGMRPGWEPIASALQAGHAMTPDGAEHCAQQVAALLTAGTDASAAALEEALLSEEAADRLIQWLPTRLLTRVVFRLRPAEHHAVLEAAQLLLDACAAQGIAASSARLQELKWQFVLRYLFVQGRSFDAADFARRMAQWLAVRLRVPAPQAWQQSLAQQVARQRRTAGQALGRAMAQALTPPAQKAGPVAAAKPAARRPAAPRADEPQAQEPIYIANAGMVLAEPFLPHLFGLRGLLQDNSFKDAASAARGVHLLQALAMGPGDFQEHELVLNKLLCGIPLADALEPCEPLQPEDLSTVEGLLQAMLQQWKVLGGTTVQGLRETFLQREGRLLRRGDDWQLLVEPGPYDMLVDQVPWGFSMIRLPWMERMIHVQWR